MVGTHRAPRRDLLLANHAFPGEYVIKAFGPADRGFEAAVQGAARAVVGSRVSSRTRPSKAGTKVCVTLELQAENVDEVIAVYEALHDIELLALIL